jgi:hypothetical protein
MPHLVRTVLKGREIDEQVCSIRDQDQYTLLHNAALNLGGLYSLYQGFWNKEQVGLEELCSLIADLVNGGSDLHTLTSLGYTPMLEIWDKFVSTYGLTHNLCPIIPSKDPIMPLKLWLKQLKESGIDLKEYGKKEKRIFQDAEDRVREAQVDPLFCLPFRGFPHKKLRLVSFSYGSELEDWKFWVEPVMENYFIDFWEMIDHPERAMPGAWQEEYSHDDIYYDSDY